VVVFAAVTQSEAVAASAVASAAVQPAAAVAADPTVVADAGNGNNLFPKETAGGESCQPFFFPPSQFSPPVPGVSLANSLGGKIIVLNLSEA
jgi:hypothetical protein